MVFVEYNILRNIEICGIFVGKMVRNLNKIECRFWCLRLFIDDKDYLCMRDEICLYLDRFILKFLY